jgi:hypothetical protein
LPTKLTEEVINQLSLRLLETISKIGRKEIKSILRCLLETPRDIELKTIVVHFKRNHINEISMILIRKNARNNSQDRATGLVL